MSESKIKFEPQVVADWFGQIMQKHHASGDENELRAAIYEWLTTQSASFHLTQKDVDGIYYNADAKAPGERVIVVTRAGNEAVKPIVLQAHMDMVVVTSSDPFPLQPYNDQEGWWKAKASDGAESTLGADDGIGIATALALLQDEDLKAFPIRCLFTVQEETNMGGVENFDIKLIEGSTYYINLDDERGGTITYGSAGGFKTTYKGVITRERMPSTSRFVKIVLGGFQGGHSGVDIAKGRPSALKLLVEGLCRMSKSLNDFSPPQTACPGSYEFQLVSLARTDVIKPNAIPTEATALIAVNEADVGPLLKSLDQWFAALQSMYPSEPTIRIELGCVDGYACTYGPMSATATNNLLSFLRLVPQGVIGLVPDKSPAVVETSSNLYDVKLAMSTFTVETSTRTSNPTLLGSQQAHGTTPLNLMYMGLGEAHGLTVETGADWYPAWPPVDTPLLAKAKEAYAQVYGKTGYVTSVIHAGLECGWIVSRCPDMQCIAVGPTIQNPHTINERLDPKSTGYFYSAVKGLLLSLFATPT